MLLESVLSSLCAALRATQFKWITSLLLAYNPTAGLTSWLLLAAAFMEAMREAMYKQTDIAIVTTSGDRAARVKLLCRRRQSSSSA